MTRIGTGLVMVCLMVTACGGSTSSPPDNVLPSVASFLEDHPEFGTIRGVEQLSDWSEGARQRVRTEGDGAGWYVFYLRDDTVQSVYREESTGTVRGAVWTAES
ncbi:MAG: hypothetical protein IH939_07585 [Acidobacteria bacterium]|nr:hypothetical protein [Acidobacteriota bacterium]